MRRRTRILLAIASVPALLLAILVARWCRPPPRIVVSRETTYLLEPLSEEGTIDYAAAWRAEHGVGVTADNNAALLLLHASGGDVGTFPAGERALLPPLGLDPREDLHPPESEDPATAGEWIDRVAPCLDLAVDASRRKRFYVPFDGPLLERPHVWELIPLQHGLAYRARQSARHGRTPPLLADVGAILRIARLAGSWSFLGPYVQFSTEPPAWEAAKAVDPSRGRLTAAECRSLVLAADRAPFLDRIRAAELDNRFLMLERICGPPILDGASPPGWLLSRADRNRMLRRLNEWFDRFGEVLDQDDGWMDRLQRRQQLLNGLTRDIRAAKEGLAFLSNLTSPDALGDFFVDVYVEGGQRMNRVLPAFACDALDADIAMAEVAALAWASENGRDPASTDELTPAIFDSPFHDRLTGSSLRFRRDVQSVLVAEGAAVDLRRELDALLRDEDRR